MPKITPIKWQKFEKFLAMSVVLLKEKEVIIGFGGEVI